MELILFGEQKLRRQTSEVVLFLILKSRSHDNIQKELKMASLRKQVKELNPRSNSA